MLKFLIAAAVVALVAATKTTYITEGRQAQVSFYRCDGCTCDNYYISAYEQDSKTKGQPDSHTSQIALYYNHYGYNTCDFTYSSHWAAVNVATNFLKISPSGKTAHLNMTSLTDSGGNTVGFDFQLYDINMASSCNCQYSEIYVAGSFKSTSTSSSYRTGVDGSLSVNGVAYTPTDAVGYIYQYGSKSLTITS